MARRLIALGAGLILVACARIVAAGSEPSASVADLRGIEASCGPAPPGGEEKGKYKRDYRQRNSSPDWAGDFRDFERYHLKPAEDHLGNARTARQVMSDLHFVLRRSPNDHRALRLLAQFVQKGYRDRNHASPECYFAWAEQFAPDDGAVWLIGGYVHWALRNYDMAESKWLQALALDEGLAEAHYNLGLLYVEQAQYTPALEHAWRAYAAGYPLPGLRNKLERAGKWRDPPVTHAQSPVPPPASTSPGHGN